MSEEKEKTLWIRVEEREEGGGGGGGRGGERQIGW